jgi:transcription elongation factor Elf1
MYRCPDCGSNDVSIRSDATVEHHQVDGEMVVTDVSTYDEVYAIWCGACGSQPDDDHDGVGYSELRRWEG